MLPEKEVAASTSPTIVDPIFIAIEMSRAKWVVGAHLPGADKVGIHVTPLGRRRRSVDADLRRDLCRMF